MPHEGYEEAVRKIKAAKKEGSAELSLTGLNLTELPPELFELSNLIRLQLNDNEITIIPDEFSVFTQLRILWFQNNKITEIPKAICQLFSLQELSLSSNQISVLPDAFSDLSNLKKLFLYNNNLGAIPEVICNIPNLEKLFLDNIQTTSIPDAISRLVKLQDLKLRSNKINSVSSSVKRLKNLIDLDLSENELEFLPEEIGDIPNLETLALNDNKIAVIPGVISKLSQLYRLSLRHNQITAIPDVIGDFRNLVSLNLDDNQISMIPDAIGRLSKLRSLSLIGNKIDTISNAIGNLSNLEILALENNQVAILPDALSKLTILETLSLENNRLEKIPDSFAELSSLERFYIHGNPDLRLPAELIGPAAIEIDFEDIWPVDPKDIIEYAKRVNANGRPLNEAKLILVGKGAVGKSSLVEKLKYGTFVKGKAKTEGINIERWELPIKGENILLNVWDFGGQEIMHATHQFFLTERSLYLLVLNGREGTEDIEAEYWLKLIGSFGGNSPVIIVLNKIKEHPFDLNRSSLLEKYPNIKAFIATDCEDDKAIEELKQAIIEQTDALDELRVKFPGEWFSIKDELAKPGRNYLSFADYRKLC